MPSGPRPRPPDGTVRVALSGTIFATYWANVFWLELGSADDPDDAALAALCDGISTAWATDIAPHVNTAVYLFNVTCTFFGPGGVERQHVGTYSHEGGVASQQHNCAASIVVNWLIGQHYRGGHPRSYLPGPDDSSITNGATLNSGYASALATAVAAFLTAVNAITHAGITSVKMGTVSFVDAGAWRAPPVFWPYIGSRIRSTLGTQKRRLTSTTP